MNKNIGELIAEYLLEDNTQQPLHPELEHWLAESSSNRAMFEEYKKIWHEICNYAPVLEFDAGVAWEKIDRINQQRQLRRRKLINAGYITSGIAATVLAFVCLFGLGYYVRPTALTEVNTKTAYGSRSEILLPDGTNVKLNAGTTINYVYNKKKNTREVDFRGEAFFEVAKSDAPFIIHNPDDLEVRVLGTTFSLSAYEEDEFFIISLLEGSVALSALKESNQKNVSNQLTLSPGDIVQYNRTTGKMERLNKDITHMYGWLNNKLYMDNTSLATACKKLERWYDVEITLEPGLGENTSYTGILQEENITDVLNALCSLSKIKYEINGRKINITRK